VAWREKLAFLLSEAFAGYPEKLDLEALADHVFVTFEGAFLLARSTGDSGHMRAQLTILRQLIEALLSGRNRHRAPAPV
jgi:TetR/AcrR family transcriptional repressor of nem operon